MKKKGFTLIELLAVIVILAIIALIATPIILNIISESKQSSSERSIDMYAKAVENAISQYQLNNNKEIIGNFTTTDGYTLTSQTETLNVDYEGNKVICKNIQIKRDGTVYLGKCQIEDEKVEYTYGIKEKVCVLTKDQNNDGIPDIGDEVTCGTESFYVLPDHDEAEEGTISMLAKYNLNVGDATYSEGIIGLQNEKVAGRKSGYTTYGTVAFSSTNYWESNLELGTFIYDSSSDIYQYVTAYQQELEKMGVDVYKATLPSYNQLIESGCSLSTWKCTAGPSWLYSTSYWTGSTIEGDYVFLVLSNALFDGDIYNTNSYFGVRPVIIIPESEI